MANPDAVFPEHDTSSAFHFAKQEEEVLAYWKAIDAFKTSLEQSKGRKPFSFSMDHRSPQACLTTDICWQAQ